MEITQTEQKKEKELRKMRIVYGTSGTTSSILTFALHEFQKKERERKGQRSYLKK